MIMRDVVVEGSENFDYLELFNVPPNLSTRAYSISASIGNAATTAGIRSCDLRDFVWDGDKPLCRSDWNFSAGCKLLPVPEIEQRVKWWTDLVIATDTVNKDGPEKHPLLVNHFIQYRGVASDDNDPLTQRNRAKLSNLQNMIIQAMNENQCKEGFLQPEIVADNCNHSAAAEFSVDQACIVRWRKRRDQVLKGVMAHKKFMGPRKGRQH
ncbi:hypothetical protein HPB51_023835 [Rhipicephalus microplus]|uniref:Uncharacterized protein n=1 Tax=Rhipicephalus microplus TaxID=6941 RepID=A0A9J6F8I8_RHIMP|nr:hypothetical protein HPB51_023835 [Rhipicephalus microplus]